VTLLSVCTAVAGDCGFGVPTTIVGNQDETAVMLLALINKSGRKLARMSWQALQKEYTFTTVNGTPSYALPTDYGAFQDDTAWDRTNYWQMRGSLSPEAWQWYKSGIQTSTPRSRFRVKSGLIYIDPTPTATNTMVVEYLSNYWVGVAAAPTVGAKSSFTLDTDVSLIDEYLLELDLTWRFLERKGLAYQEAKKEAEDMIDQAIGADVPQNTVNMANSNELWPPLPTTPRTGYS
jgi:hypothetical protein